MGARPAHGHGGVFCRPAALQGEVLNGRDVVQMPLQQGHIGGCGDQGMVVPAVSHRQRNLQDYFHIERALPNVERVTGE